MAPKKEKVTEIKFDVSGVDFKEALEAGKGFKQPKPGVYKAKVVEFTPGFTRDKETGKPDPKKPRVEVIFEIQDKEYKGAKLWYYLTFGEGFPRVKLAQFLLAYGLVKKGKTAGTITAKDIKKILATVVKIRIVKGTDNAGDYRAEVGQVLDASTETDEDDVDDEDTDDEEDEDEDEDEDEEDEDEEDEDEDEDDEEIDYSEWDVKDLRKELKSRELSTKGGKPALIKRLQEDDESDEEDEDEDSGPF